MIEIMPFANVKQNETSEDAEFLSRHLTISYKSNVHN